VVGRSRELPAVLEHPVERPRQLGTVGHEHREVEEPGRTRRPLGRIGVSDELEQRRPAVAAQGDGSVALVLGAQAEDALVEGPLVPEVRNRE
jgi:hypothetical protein